MLCLMMHAQLSIIISEASMLHMTERSRHAHEHESTFSQPSMNAGALCSMPGWGDPTCGTMICIRTYRLCAGISCLATH